MSRLRQFLGYFLPSILLYSSAAACDPLPGTEILTATDDFAMVMVRGIRHHLDGLTAETLENRNRTWWPDSENPEEFRALLPERRAQLAKILGVTDERLHSEFLRAGSVSQPPVLAETSQITVQAVRWPVVEGVEGEGLLLEPKGEVLADVIAVPDCDWTPETFAGLTGDGAGVPAFPKSLAEQGCRVLIPFLIDRAATYSGNPKYRMTNQPHREFLYRPAYEMGRHIIGYEIQKILAAADGLEKSSRGERPLGLAGYGEGGLLCLYAGALDERFEAVGVCGYFGPRENLYSEPIYRNVWSFLRDFGDAEVASMILPRQVIIEPSQAPDVMEPPQWEGRSGGAPGRISTPASEAVLKEFEELRGYARGLGTEENANLVESPEGLAFSEAFHSHFSNRLGLKDAPAHSGSGYEVRWEELPGEDRLQRQFEQILEHTQRVMWTSDPVREVYWSNARAGSVGEWEESTREYRNLFWEEAMGKLPDPVIPLHPRTRRVYDTPEFTGYEVVLDVYPEVIAYGILLVPKDIARGEKRPLVVCQHGLEGRPQEVADPAVDSQYYHQFACQLARRGFIAYAPQNPYIGGDEFRVLQRMANPLGYSLFSYIIRQHERTLDWLSSLPFVDPERMAFYGLSYGGKTAMRVPAVLTDYCLSICSGDFNEWIWKNVSYDHKFTYLFTGEYEMPEWNLGNTFNYAEMAGLICPRPFMVERGHGDGVGIDEWVAYEFAKVFRLYDRLGIGDRATIEYFDGPHTIHGVGTFDFLHEQLDWPKPGE